MRNTIYHVGRQYMLVHMSVRLLSGAQRAQDEAAGKAVANRQKDDGDREAQTHASGHIPDNLSHEGICDL